MCHFYSSDSSFDVTERSLNLVEVLAKLGLPKDNIVKGYVIHLPRKDGFVTQK